MRKLTSTTNLKLSCKLNVSHKHRRIDKYSQGKFRRQINDLSVWLKNKLYYKREKTNIKLNFPDRLISSNPSCRHRIFICSRIERKKKEFINPSINVFIRSIEKNKKDKNSSRLKFSKFHVVQEN